MIYRQPSFSLPEPSKRSHRILKENIHQRVGKMRKLISKYMGVVLIASIIFGVVSLLVWAAYNDWQVQTAEQKDCHQYKDMAMRDAPMRCMHYWAHHHND